MINEVENQNEGQEEKVNIEEVLFGKDEPTNDIEDSIDDIATIAGGNEDTKDTEDNVQPAEEQTTEQPSTEETAQDKLKFVQTSYQKHLELLKQSDPMLFNQIQAQVKSERGKGLDASPVDDDVDDPYTQQIQKGFDNLQKQMSTQLNAEKYMQEFNQANKALDGFIVENNVSEEDLNVAFNAATEMGFDINTASRNFTLGIPNKTVTYVMEKLRSKLLEDYYSGRATTIENETLEKATAVNNLAQPKPGAIPESKKLTRDESLLQSMNNVGKQEVLDRIFKT